jgi:hypothetical protein
LLNLELSFSEEEEFFQCTSQKKISRKSKDACSSGKEGVPKENITFVKWEVVCRSKKKGGLGIMDIRKMNICLPCKWWWKLGREECIWQDIGRAKYLRKSKGINGGNIGIIFSVAFLTSFTIVILRSHGWFCRHP